MRLIDADKLKEMTCYNCHEDGFELGNKYCRWEDVCFNLAMIKDAPTVDAIPVSYFASELAEIKLILKRKDISKTYREELEAEKRYLVGWINHWRWDTGRGCRGWAFQPLSDDEIVKEAMPTTYGSWVGIDEFPHEVWECDRCGGVIEMEKPYDFCPYCGAKMDAERKEECD